MPRGAYDMDPHGAAAEKDHKKAQKAAIEYEMINEALRLRKLEAANAAKAAKVAKEAKEAEAAANTKIKNESSPAHEGSCTTKTRSQDCGRSWGQVPARNYRPIKPKTSQDRSGAYS